MFGKSKNRKATPPPEQPQQQATTATAPPPDPPNNFDQEMKDITKRIGPDIFTAEEPIDENASEEEKKAVKKRNATAKRHREINEGLATLISEGTKSFLAADLPDDVIAKLPSPDSYNLIYQITNPAAALDELDEQELTPMQRVIYATLGTVLIGATGALTVYQHRKKMTPQQRQVNIKKKAAQRRKEYQEMTDEIDEKGNMDLSKGANDGNKK